MTCAHVLGLIDADPFADYPRAHLDAAWQHARQCGTCRPALEAATVLTRDLAALLQPAPPPDLSEVVMARIGRIEDMPEPRLTRDWPAWATVIGGLAAALAIVSSMGYGPAAPIDAALSRITGVTIATFAMPATISGAVALSVGLVLYVAGLFGMLNERRLTKNRASP